VENPAVGYYDLMFAPICFDEAQGILGAACPWSHYKSGITFVDNEYVIFQFFFQKKIVCMSV